jgi:hypothetical protein
MGSRSEKYDEREIRFKISHPDRIYLYTDEKKYLGQISKRFSKALGNIQMTNKNFAKFYNYYPIFHDIWVSISEGQQQLRALYKNETDMPLDLVNFIEKDLKIMRDYIISWHPKKIRNCRHCDNGSKSKGKTFCPHCFLGKTGGTLKEYIEDNYD